MLSNTLNTNEIKNSAGTEVEFTRIDTSGRTTEFMKINEAPNAPCRLRISHQEIGSGAAKRRRSLVQFRETVIGVDGTPVEVVYGQTMDIPIGNLSTTAAQKNVLAYGMSFVASLGASTTILYDGTGNGADILLNGGL